MEGTKRLYVAFYEPRSFIGNIIVWRTKDDYSHSALILENMRYESKFPKVRWLPLDGSIYEDAELILEVDIDDLEESLLKKFFAINKGRWYDVLALLGWLLGIREIQFRNNTYCHEFVRQAFVEMGRLMWSYELITAKRLLDELGIWDVGQGLQPSDRVARETNLPASIRVHYQRGVGMAGHHPTRRVSGCDPSEVQ